MNSWIGGGLSSLKGQLSHLITEGTEENSESIEEIEKSKKKISELENELENSIIETSDLKERNNELIMKLQSEELLLQNVSQSYQEKLKEKEEIIESLTNKISRFRVVSEGSLDDELLCSVAGNREDNISGEYYGPSIPYRSSNEIHALKSQINILTQEVAKWKALSEQHPLHNSDHASEFDNTIQLLLEEQQRQMELQHSSYVMELQHEHTNQIQFLNHRIQQLQQAVNEVEDNREFFPDSFVAVPEVTGGDRRKLEERIQHEIAIQVSENVTAFDSSLVKLLDACCQVATEDQIRSMLGVISARINNHEDTMESLITRITECQNPDFPDNVELISLVDRKRTSSSGGIPDSQLAANRLSGLPKPTRAESISQLSDMSELSIKSRLLDEHVKILSSQLTDYEKQLISIEELSAGCGDSANSADGIAISASKIDSKINNLKSKLCERKINISRQQQINLSEVTRDDEHYSNIDDSWENASVNSLVEEPANEMLAGQSINHHQLPKDIFDSYRLLFPNAVYDASWDVLELLRNVFSSVSDLLDGNRLLQQLKQELMSMHYDAVRLIGCSNTISRGGGGSGSPTDLLAMVAVLKHSFTEMKETCAVHNYIQEENKSLQQLLSQCQLTIANLDREKSDLLSRNTELDEQLMDFSITVARYEGLETVCDSYQRQLAAVSVARQQQQEEGQQQEGTTAINAPNLSMDSEDILEHVATFNQEKDECIQALESKIISLQNLCEEKDDDIAELTRREQDIVYEYDSLIQVLKGELDVVRAGLEKHGESERVLLRQQQEWQEAMRQKELMITCLNEELTMLSVIDSDDTHAHQQHRSIASDDPHAQHQQQHRNIGIEASTQTDIINDSASQSSEIISLEQQISCLQSEKERLEQVLEAQANSLGQYEANVNNLQSELTRVSNQSREHSHSSQALTTAATGTMEGMAKETLRHLSQMIRDKEWEIEALKSKNGSLCEIIQKFSSDQSDVTTMECIESVLNEKESLSKELAWYQENREQLISALNLKHKESLNYHGEIQRLIAYINGEQGKWNEMDQLRQQDQQQRDQQQRDQQQQDQQQQEHQLDQNVQANSSSTSIGSSPPQAHQAVPASECHQCKQMRDQFIDSQQENRIKSAEMRHLQKHSEQIAFELEQAQLQIAELTSSYDRAQQQLEYCQNELANQYKIHIVPSNDSDESTKSIWNTEYQQEITKADGEIDERAQLHLMMCEKQINCDSYIGQIEQLKARETKLLKEKQIFQDHLIRIEESYTQEATLAEDREQTLRKQLRDTEDDLQMAKDDISKLQIIIGNIRNELSDEMNELRVERDAIKLQLKEAEMQRAENLKSLGNLQLVLERFQQEQSLEMMFQKERFQQDIDRLIKERDSCDERNRWLQNEMNIQKGLVDAAQRLSDQVELKDDQLAELQALLSKKEELIDQLKMDIRKLNSFTESKVDKVLMKNLVIGYFHTPTHRRQEALKVIGSLLQFADSDYNQIGIDTANKSRWFSWLRSGTGDRASGADDQAAHGKSFSELFITFLENESSPMPQVKLPTNQIAAEARQHSSLSQSDEYPYTHSTSLPAIIDHHKFFPTSSPVVTKRNGSPSIDHGQTGEQQQQVTKPFNLLYIPNITDDNIDSNHKELKLSSNHRRSESNRNVLLSLLDQ